MHENVYGDSFLITGMSIDCRTAVLPLTQSDSEHETCQEGGSFCNISTSHNYLERISEGMNRDSLCRSENTDAESWR